MIYHQSALYYLMAITATIGCWRRLKDFFQENFSSNYSLLIAGTVLLHPLSIDAVIGPNLLHGTVAFWLILEALFFLKREENEWALGLFTLAALCNMAYSLLPLYYFFKLNSPRKLMIPAVAYLFLIGIFFTKLSFKNFHNPLSFLNFFYMNLIVPSALNNFTSSLFKLTGLGLVALGITLTFLIYVARKKPELNVLMPLLFLPVIGEVIYQWDSKDNFWSDIIFTGSNYLCMIFAFVAILAAYVPKKIFIAYTFLILFFSYNWSIQWRPFSELLSQSILNLPEDYPEAVKARRTYAWELMHEGKFIQARSYLRELSTSSPNEDIKKDLQLLENKQFTPK